MSEWFCKECGSKFDSKRGLHRHLKVHYMSIAEYYEKHYPREDWYSGEPILYKDYDQYFSDNFVSFENYMKWVKTAPKSKVKKYLVTKFKLKAVHKNLKCMPPNLFYDLYHIANRFTIENVWGDYNNFCKEAGLINNYQKDLPENFWSKTPKDLTIFVDTREQLPIEFDNTLSQKLDFGDYTAGGKYFSKTFVDRKSRDDFRSTFGKDIERFKREMDRCVQFDSYMFVVVESHIDEIESKNKTSKFKSNLSYVWHNVRDLMAIYPNNLQFIFAHNRAGAKKIIPKILYHGKDIRQVDVQYHIDEKVHGKQHIYELS